MKIYVKNMACESCKILVKGALAELDIPLEKIELGEIETKEDVSDELKQQLNAKIKVAGLELLEKKQGMIVDRIKKAIIDYIYNSEKRPFIKLSAMLKEQLDHSYNYLSNLFSEVEATTISQYVILLKIERIKELLVLEEHTLSEISYKLHYSSVAHLSTQFKRITGLTPSHFKKLKERRRATIQSI